MKIDWREVPGRYIKDPRLGHRLGRNYPPGEIVNHDWNIRWLGTDAEGFIYNSSPNRDFALRDSSFFRAFLLGGSTVMGLGVEKNVETMASQLELKLSEILPRARTVNCGCGAYTSWQQLLYLSLELIIHKPDVIIVLDGWNDFVHSSWGNKGYGGKWIPNTLHSLDDIVAIIQNATAELTLAQFIKRKLSKIPAISALKPSGKYSFRQGHWEYPDYRLWSYKPESVTYYLANMKSIIGIALAHEVKVVCLLQPQLLWPQMRVPTKEENDHIRKIKSRMPRLPELAPLWFSDAQRQLTQVHSKLHDGKRVWIEDASTWLDDIQETVYHDYNHYNAQGQKLLASKIYTILTRLFPDLERRYENSCHDEKNREIARIAR